MKNSTALCSAFLLVASIAFAQRQSGSQLPSQLLQNNDGQSNVTLLGNDHNQSSFISAFEQNGDKSATPQLHVRNDAAQLEDALETYPNPSNGLFKLRLPENIQIISIEVYDLTGELVFVDKGNALDVPQDKTVDISAEEGAIFIVLVRTPTKVYAERISVIR